MREDNFEIADELLESLTNCNDGGAGTFGSLLHIAVNKLRVDHFS